jgi:putative spermidine/putrescine transport system permease protein
MSPRAAARLEAVVAWGAALASIFPFAYLLFLSVAAPAVYPALFPESLRFDRWRAVLGAGELLPSLAVSFMVSTAVALLATSAGYLSGRAVAREQHPSRLLLLAYLPYALSPVILGACLLFFFIRLGLVGTVPGVVLAHTIPAFGFSVVFWVPFWNEEKRSMEELVQTLGGTRRQALGRVLLPLSREPLVLCFFQTFLVSWFQYGLTVLVGGGKVQTLPVRIYDYLGEADMGYAAVASLLLVVPPLVLLGVNRRIARWFL